MRRAVAALVAVVWGHSMAAGAECLSKGEARERYRTSHLYWHGVDHCWDNQRHRQVEPGRQGGGRVEPVSPPLPVKPVPVAIWPTTFEEIWNQRIKR